MPGQNPLLLLIAAVGLAGCTVADLRGNEPVVQYESSKSPDQLAGCIAGGWEGTAGAVSTQLRNDGYVVTINGAWGPDAAAFITKTAAASSVRYAERVAGLSPGSWRRAVEACK